jgi:phosphomannomutase/phosphoglucomutase
MLSDLPETVFTPEIRVDCPDEIKFQIAERARDRFRELGYDIIDVDGVRVLFEDGWGLIRASNTQPVLVTRFESSNRESLEKNRALVQAEIDRLKEEMTVA